MVKTGLEQMAFKHNKDLWLDRVIYGSICKSIHTFQHNHDVIAVLDCSIALVVVTQKHTNRRYVLGEFGEEF